LPAIRFTAAEMDAFANASGDRNPVHLDGPAGMAGGFEAPVVYGALAVLRTLAALPPRRDAMLRTLDATFHRPLFVEHEYQLTVDDRESLAPAVSVSDSGLLAVAAKGFFAVGPLPRAQVQGRQPADALTGHHYARADAVRRLDQRFAPAAHGLGETALPALLCVSWIAGMRLPGPGSLLTSLHITFAPAIADGPGALTYRASVVEREPRFGEVTVAGVLADRRAGQVAAFTFQARAPGGGSRAVGLAARERRALERELPPSRALGGRVAVVVGASRGLGAALAYGLALQGCHVYTCSRSPAEPAAVGTAAAGVGLAQVGLADVGLGADDAGLARAGMCGGGDDDDGRPLAIEHCCGDGRPPAIEHCAGDAGDPDFTRALLARVLAAHGGIDLLVCCAAPRLEPIGFGPGSVARFNAFVHRSIDLFTVPLATFLESVHTRSGTCLLVSSAALRTLPRDWGHYVAAKAAGEALAVWAATRFPDVELVVARVPALREVPERDGVALAQVAARLVGRLVERGGSGVHLFEW
jgi:NAD(P)-dependent dehydrogenase (short-subunit alcohol dehydrogenase family)